MAFRFTAPEIILCIKTWICTFWHESFSNYSAVLGIDTDPSHGGKQATDLPVQPPQTSALCCFSSFSLFPLCHCCPPPPALLSSAPLSPLYSYPPQSVFKACLSFIKLFSFPHYQLPWRPHLSDYLNFIISIDLGAFHLFYCFSVNFRNE